MVAFTRGARNRWHGVRGGAWMLPVKVPMGCLAWSMDTMGNGGDGTLLVSRRLVSSTPSSTRLFGIRCPRIAAWSCYPQWREVPLPVVALPYGWPEQLDPLPTRAIAQLFKLDETERGL